MEEKKFVKIRKEEFGVKEYIKKEFGMGKVSTVKIDYTPVGERILVFTHKPGMIIGKRGETIEKLTTVLKKRFKMENPHIDIEEIKKPELDAQLVADEIALALERFGSMRFKAVSYRMLMKIKTAGALGAEVVTSGRLPSERAKTWRFKYGYLKKTGDDSNLVSKAESVAKTTQGVVGIKVSILAPGQKMSDQIDVTEEMMNQIKQNVSFVEEPEKKKSRKKN
jgi:small subunit ribosomal protein S3